MNTNTDNNTTFTESEIKDLKWKASLKYYVTHLISCLCVAGSLLIILHTLVKQKDFNKSVEDRLSRIESQILNSSDNQ